MLKRTDRGFFESVSAVAGWRQWQSRRRSFSGRRCGLHRTSAPGCIARTRAEDVAECIPTHAANHHEITLVQLTFDFYMIEARPENLIGDRAYDSDRLDAEVREQGTEMIASHRSNRVRRKTQDGRRLRRYERR